MRAMTSLCSESSEGSFEHFVSRLKRLSHSVLFICESSPPRERGRVCSMSHDAEEPIKSVILICRPV